MCFLGGGGGGGGWWWWWVVVVGGGVRVKSSGSRGLRSDEFGGSWWLGSGWWVQNGGSDDLCGWEDFIR